MEAMNNLYDSSLVSLFIQERSVKMAGHRILLHARILWTLVLIYFAKQYCSECFLQLYRQRLLDPWLVQSNFTDYLIGQFDNLQSNCSTSLPYTTSASTLYLATVTATATTTATTQPPATTCTGQVLAPLATPMICDDLSDT
jgi:hypothetical protein